MIIERNLYRAKNILATFISTGYQLLFSFRGPSTEHFGRSGEAQGFLLNHGIPRLLKDESGELLCSSCQECVHVCPTDCLEVRPASEESNPSKPRPSVFRLDLPRCIECGLCQEYCPEEALVLVPYTEKELKDNGSTWDRDQLLFSKVESTIEG